MKKMKLNNPQRKIGLTKIVNQINSFNIYQIQKRNIRICNLQMANIYIQLQMIKQLEFGI